MKTLSTFKRQGNEHRKQIKYFMRIFEWLTDKFWITYASLLYKSSGIVEDAFTDSVVITNKIIIIILKRILEI